MTARALLCAALAALLGALSAPASAGEWRAGDTGPVGWACFEEEVAVRASEAWEVSRRAAEATQRALDRSGDCGLFGRPMMVTLVRHVRSYVDAEGDNMAVWQVDVFGTRMYTLIFADRGPHRDEEAGAFPIPARGGKGEIGDADCGQEVSWPDYRHDILAHPDNAGIQLRRVADLIVFLAAYNRTPPRTDIRADAAYYFVQPDAEPPWNRLGFLVFVVDGCVYRIDRHALTSIEAWERGEVRP